MKLLLAILSLVANVGLTIWVVLPWAYSLPPLMFLTVMYGWAIAAAIGVTCAIDYWARSA